MSLLPDDDQDLVDFLRQHRSPTPPPAANLDRKIMSQIVAPVDRPRWNFWLVAPTLAASLITAVLGYRAWVPPQPNAAEVAMLEAFVESNWHDTIYDNSEIELISTNDE